MLMLPVTCLKITGLSRAAILKKCIVDTQRKYEKQLYVFCTRNVYTPQQSGE